ncbi:hypothetical protein FJ366_00740 [Candidatus Dependentiae bacterium]|nr:hypothetical protein [Candidatus Dependentiae bacterium]
MILLAKTLVSALFFCTLSLVGFSTNYSTLSLTSEHKDSFLDACTPNKKHIYGQLFAKNESVDEQITVFSRPNISELSQKELHILTNACKKTTQFLTSRTKKFFTYQHAPRSKKALLITLNFADPALFRFCKSNLFAQDEIQVAEHPHLGLLAQEIAEDAPAVLDTRSNSVIIHNVPQLCRIDSQKPIDGKILYGNNFASASVAEIDHRLSLLEPHQNNTLLAICAPNVTGRRVYTTMMIQDFFAQILSGFQHTQAVTTELGFKKIIIHSGGLGTGAFGHHKVVSIVLQLIAAQIVSQSMKNPRNLEIRFFGTTEKTYRKAFDIFKAFKSQLKKEKFDFSHEILTQENENRTVEILVKIFNQKNIFPHQGTGD